VPLIHWIPGVGVTLSRYYPDKNICAFQYRWGDYADYNDLDKIRNMEVQNPEIRDQLLEYAENPPEDLGPVVILMHMSWWARVSIVTPAVCQYFSNLHWLL